MTGLVLALDVLGDAVGRRRVDEEAAAAAEPAAGEARAVDLGNRLRGVDGVLGARLSGGGFGGSVVALVRRERAEAAAEAIAGGYAARQGIRCEVIPITPSAGARIVRG